MTVVAHDVVRVGVGVGVETPSDTRPTPRPKHDADDDSVADVQGETWVLIPAKDFGSAKSRLSAALSNDERCEFAQRCLGHVIQTTLAHQEISGALIVTQSQAVGRFAKEHGAVIAADPLDATRLNEVVDQGLAILAERGASRVLVLMSDLPHVSAADIERVLDAGREVPVVLVPDREEEGTNGLLVSPPDRLPTCFGASQSYTLHAERLRQLGIPFTSLLAHGIAHDVDTPADLDTAEQRDS